MKTETVWIVVSTDNKIIQGVYRNYRDAQEQVLIYKDEGLSILKRKVL